MRSARRIALVGLVLLFALFAPELQRFRDASAHENELGFASDVRRAQLIFEGEVVGVDY